jgi:FkbM family methyltransferase
VGAAYGAYTLPALAAGATVHAFEPVRDVCADLRRNVELNGWRSRCAVYEFGLWDSLATVRLGDYAPHWPAGTAEEPFTVDTLDNWAKRTGIERLDWLKMDIEGAEERALRGGIETIEKLRPRLIIEAHTFMDAEIVGKLRALLPGYLFDEYPREPCVMLVGRPT